MSPLSLTIIIVNFRTPKLTLDCLESLAREQTTFPHFRAVVVDNGSGDDSASLLQSQMDANAWGHWCQLLPLDTNLGFAGGNNTGIRWVWEQDAKEGQSRTTYVLLLNSDTIVHPGCLKYCVEAMEAQPRLGTMSCKLLNADGSLQIVARKYMSPLRLLVGVTGLPWKMPSWFGWAQLEYRGWDMNREAGAPEWIGGAFMLLRTETMDQVGLLDEDFFFYGEDAEYCFRIHRSGWSILYDPSVTTTHLGGASSDPSRLMTEAKSKAVWRARYLFLSKCYGRLAMWLVRIIDILVITAKRLWFRVTGRADSIRGQQLQLTQRTLMGKLGPL